MAANPVLVDSSYYITLLRTGRDPLLALALTAETRDLAICGVVRCEVGRGLKMPGDKIDHTKFTSEPTQCGAG